VHTAADVPPILSAESVTSLHTSPAHFHHLDTFQTTRPDSLRQLSADDTAIECKFEVQLLF